MTLRCEKCNSKNVSEWTAYYWLNKLGAWLCLNCIYKKGLEK